MTVLALNTDQVVRHLAALRAAMGSVGVEACVVPGSDPHLSEYVPDRWRGRAWLSGFTGSNGTLVVTQNDAGLWTDGRYWEQGAAELEGTGVQLMKITASLSQSPYLDWICEKVMPGATVALDGFAMSLSGVRALDAGLKRAGLTLRTNIDLLDIVWTKRPGLPAAPVYEHRVPYATRQRSEKLEALRVAMAAKGAQWHFISTLDDLGWLLNLRGSDVSYNPVFVAHALVGNRIATLFIAEGKVPHDVSIALARDGVDIAPYQAAELALSLLPVDATLLIDPARVACEFIRAVPSGVKLVESINPTTLFKSRKSELDAEHIRATMEQDGAALAEFFAWLEKAVCDEGVTELMVDEKLTAARARRPGFVTPSFCTIAGFNANGALPHYSASQSSNAEVKGDGLLLIDSGGQYLGGTTDITRVVPIGNISADHRRDFTLVLKGVIALSRASFPCGTRSPMLDALARAPLWDAGIDFGHGTGHGVGYFMNVHEGPQVINFQATAEPWTAMEAGMVTSIEPGIYRPGKWGIRIENLVMTRSGASSEFGDFLEFETLTLCPIDARCIALHMLNEEERDWINTYHATVWERVSPHVQGEAKAWLAERTSPL
ncbi:MAG: aminopeptidase P family protein [Burkholderia sp.]|jgi:Xaa-Pro aminopeptidase|uniref:aminopeptidase P family protein n=1 Tax=Burkholderia sp. TaxID=36773 RepID=UPI0028193A45|nr:aminopeptidase P family protein [Burkholderia sp.]MDR0241392.1 aminopeptidase P family protein [Burkholderia sp.]